MLKNVCHDIHNRWIAFGKFVATKVLWFPDGVCSISALFDVNSQNDCHENRHQNFQRKPSDFIHWLLLLSAATVCCCCCFISNEMYRSYWGIYVIFGRILRRFDHEICMNQHDKLSTTFFWTISKYKPKIIQFCSASISHRETTVLETKQWGIIELE